MAILWIWFLHREKLIHQTCKTFTLLCIEVVNPLWGYLIGEYNICYDNLAVLFCYWVNTHLGQTLLNTQVNNWSVIFVFVYPRLDFIHKHKVSLFLNTSPKLWLERWINVFYNLYTHPIIGYTHKIRKCKHRQQVHKIKQQELYHSLSNTYNLDPLHRYPVWIQNSACTG